ncbi:glycosyltransferase [Microbulbifer sp. SAOS-129_SWC]|uniref:glycosyltransferase n=1 Tax=Microbulbifer sp. SAOS-129_SWC TaxID=3145235 RepID=UPI00321800E4
MSGLKKMELPTVIIPAYNEEASISELLDDIYPGIAKNHYSVIVACNGCSDRTVDIVRTRFPAVTCLDIDTPSKVNALNAAEALGPGFPRVYVDADVRISEGSLRHLIERCDSVERPQIAVPRVISQTGRCGWWVRRYYAAWEKTVFCTRFGYGTGIYALNKVARAAFARFPEIIADDGYIRAVHGYRHILICSAATSQVTVPKNLYELIKIKIRSKLGNLQLQRDFNFGSAPVPRASRFSAAPSPAEFLAYTVVNMIARLQAKRYLRRFSSYRWHRDESSRSST